VSIKNEILFPFLVKILQNKTNIYFSVKSTKKPIHMHVGINH